MAAALQEVPGARADGEVRHQLDGVFLEYWSLSGEVVVGTANGVLRTRTVRERPEKQRWTSDCLDMVGGSPGKPNPSDDLGGEVMPAIDMPMAVPEVEIRRPEYCEGEIEPRRQHLRTRDFKEHGATRSCKGCIGNPSHKACGKRMTEAIAETDEGRERPRRRRRGSRSSGLEAGKWSLRSQPRSERGGRMSRWRRRYPTVVREWLTRGPDGKAERTRLRPRNDDDDEDMLLEVACQDDFDEAGWAEEYVDGQVVAEEFNDDQSGKKLDPKKVRQAREEELVLERRVYVEADVEECVKVTGKNPIQVRWVDVDKGFGVYRSTLVAKDFRPKNKIDDREGLYAATPPLEVVKFLIMQAATKCRQREVRKVMLFDSSKAHLCAPVEGEQYVDLAPERAKAWKCAKLLYTLDGLRTAASSWEREYSQTLETEGFVPGIASKCTFFHPARTIRILVHGGDFVIEGGQEDLDWTKGVLANKNLVKVRSILGPELQDDKVGVVEWHDDEL